MYRTRLVVEFDTAYSDSVDEIIQAIEFAVEDVNGSVTDKITTGGFDA